jgi:hypothetical protein
VRSYDAAELVALVHSSMTSRSRVSTYPSRR